MRSLGAILTINFLLVSCGNPEPISTVLPSPPPTHAPANTPSETATAVRTPVDERELRPAYEEVIEREFLGVWITTKIITDGSLDPIITAIHINDRFKNFRGQSAEEAITEFTARTIYKVWLKKGGPDGAGSIADIDLEEFMVLWAKAQQSGNPTDWEKVQITILANDLDDGNGYRPEKTTIWPMYSGTAPAGVRAISEFNFAFARLSRIMNTTPVYERGAGGVAMGTNLDSSSLFIYVTFSPWPSSSSKEFGVVELISGAPSWMIYSAVERADEELMEQIGTKGATRVVPARGAYNAAFLVFP